MAELKYTLENWYNNWYADGKRIRLQETWGTTSTDKKNVDHASGIAMKKIKQQIDFIKHKRPDSTFKIESFKGAEPELSCRRQGAWGWINAFENTNT